MVIMIKGTMSNTELYHHLMDTFGKQYWSSAKYLVETMMADSYKVNYSYDTYTQKFTFTDAGLQAMLICYGDNYGNANWNSR